MKNTKLMIDANILLDVLSNRKPFVEDSSLIWKLCESNRAEGYVSSLTFANIVYILRKELSPSQIKDLLSKLSLIFHFIPLDISDLQEAAQLEWKDFEDAIQSATAKRIHADYIITRNVRDFSNSKVIAFSPTEFLSRL